ncbi:ATP synthase F1 subunit gamma [Anaerotalea alkaliphila]|uniref:ATP synthase gamma chain n=1 Tax=Anaerotalea alkaliphila TaxID=2662126 RepID=A0A7X5HU52_9FIRM|nr:ATP synthase F1 subunit gamma [Anaerotalea alkaliphila]NDL66717.1 ATP synthase F1 subunit gamma [Anaerotalea alkaliphila]
MASMREIKRRKISIQSTQQITKAMKLVATAKLQKAKQEADSARPYFKVTKETVASILAQSSGLHHPLLEERNDGKTLYVVITSNRGLAGGYNGNVVKLVLQQEENPSQAKVAAIGKKGRDLLNRSGFSIYKELHGIMEAPEYGPISELGDEILELFLQQEVDQVHVAYTAFNSSISQEPKLLQILPLGVEGLRTDLLEGKTKQDPTEPMNYDPSPEAVLEMVIPKYVKSVLYGALKESIASEHGARMTAMDSATNNASDMIDDLTLDYNRARQATITQELSEIVGGAEALK